MKLYEVPRFPGYAVDHTGNVFTNKRGPWRMLCHVVDRNGYLKVQICKDGKVTCTGAHRIACEAFHGPAPAGMVARHLNGIPSDNRPENLAWGTPSQNTQDRRDHGTFLLGDQCPPAKVTRDDVIEIRRLRALGWTLKAIGSKFGLKFPAIGHICSGRNWGHVSEGLR